MTIEIVDFPMKNGIIFHSYVSWPEGTIKKLVFLDVPTIKNPWDSLQIWPDGACGMGRIVGASISASDPKGVDWLVITMGYSTEHYLLGGWPTPLKNMSE